MSLHRRRATMALGGAGLCIRGSAGEDGKECPGGFRVVILWRKYPFVEDLTTCAVLTFGGCVDRSLSPCMWARYGVPRTPLGSHQLRHAMERKREHPPEKRFLDPSKFIYGALDLFILTPRLPF